MLQALFQHISILIILILLSPGKVLMFIHQFAMPISFPVVIRISLCRKWVFLQCALCSLLSLSGTNIVKKARAASAFSLQGKHTEEQKADLQPHLLAIAKQRPGSQEFFNIKGEPSLHLIIFWNRQDSSLLSMTIDNRHSSVFKVSLVHTTT